MSTRTFSFSTRILVAALAVPTIASFMSGFNVKWPIGVDAVHSDPRSSLDFSGGDKNVYDKELAVCSLKPMTGFMRTGKCSSGPHDSGTHVVCAKMTKEFLEYTKSMGNDLSTPRSEYGFPGLVPGNQWCLCAVRWTQAMHAGKAPPVILDATHKHALAFDSLQTFEQHKA